jgi:hypothetical protein
MVPVKPGLGVRVAVKAVLVVAGLVTLAVSGVRLVSVKSVTVSTAGSDVFPPALAVMLVAPGMVAEALARPPTLMLATVGALEAQVKIVPGIGMPPVSKAVALKACVPPTGMLAAVGVIVIVAIAGALTLMTAALEVLPKALAVMLVLLVINCAVASPFVAMLATVGTLEAQVTFPVCKVNVSPVVVLAVAVNCCVCPYFTAALAGVMAMLERIGVLTVMLLLALLPL